MDGSQAPTRVDFLSSFMYQSKESLSSCGWGVGRVRKSKQGCLVDTSLEQRTQGGAAVHACGVFSDDVTYMLI